MDELQARLKVYMEDAMGKPEVKLVVDMKEVGRASGMAPDAHGGQDGQVRGDSCCGRKVLDEVLERIEQ